MTAEQKAEVLVERVGRYRLLGEIARGGMATVHFARLAAAHGFEKWVAVKLMHEHMSQDENFVGMFHDEARIVSQLNHPNICQVMDFGDDDGRLYLVMEYLHGETLSSVVRSAWRGGNRLPLWFCARIIADAARGLHAAHELKDRDGKTVGLVHRDVSPQNIMVLYDGVGKLMDFGVVRAEGRLTETAAGTLKGKFAYMAPEELRGGESDKRADIWALGVMLWEITCGQRLFRAKGEGQTAVLVLQSDIPDPRSLIEGFPDSLADIIMGCLQRDQDNRIGTARDVAVGLERYLLEAGTIAAPEDVSEVLEQQFPGRAAERRAELQQRQALSERPPPPDESSSTTMSRVREVSSAAPARPDRRPVLFFFLVLLAVGLVSAGLVIMNNTGGQTVSTPIAQTQAAPETPFAEVTPVPTVMASPVEEQPTDTPEAAEPTIVMAAAAVMHARMTARPRRGMRAERAQTPMEPAVAMMVETTMAAVPEGDGRLNLLSIPSAQVTLNGRSIGRTPLIRYELPSGRHRLTLTAADGSTKTVNVTIRADETTRQSVVLND
ncbi:MAG: serine/threonine protein kinase [Polyangiales bacterium]|jgi:serine/threonine protein kinase